MVDKMGSASDKNQVKGCNPQCESHVNPLMHLELGGLISVIGIAAWLELSAHSLGKAGLLRRD